MALRDNMRESAAQYLQPGGKTSMKRARGVVMELPRSTRLGPGTGIWHRIPAGSETLRVHRRFFKDLETADSVGAAVSDRTA
jgi:hypothetical protein